MRNDPKRKIPRDEARLRVWEPAEVERVATRGDLVALC